MTELPAWIDPEAWADFVEMRKAMKSRAPWTPGAQKLIVRELAKLLDQGFDPNESLRQSVMQGWRGVFPAKRYQQPLGNTESFKQRDDRAAAERVAAATGGLVSRQEVPLSIGMFEPEPRYVRRIA